MQRTRACVAGMGVFRTWPANRDVQHVAGGVRALRHRLVAGVLFVAGAAGAQTSSEDATLPSDWLEGQSVREWLAQETARAWQEERRQPDLSAAAAGTRSPSPRLRALYGSGRFRAAELDIGGERYVLSTDASGRLRPQHAAGYRLVALQSNCVVLHRDGVRTDLCWRGDGDALR